MAEPRIPVGAEVEWTTSGWTSRRLRGRVIAFVPAGESAWSLLPEEVVERIQRGSQPPFNDRSAHHRYLVLVEAEAKPSEVWDEREARFRLHWPKLRPLTKPRYACPLAGTLEKQVRGEHT